MPPRRPELQAGAERAIYFSEPAHVQRKVHTAGAFDRLKPAKSRLTDD